MSANSALCLVSADPKPLEFLRTPFGGRLLVLESFLYKQEKAVGDKVYWKCREHTELGCRGRAITRGARATVMRDHCHPPDEEGLEARRQKQKLRGPVLPESSEGPEVHRGQVEEPVKGAGPWLCPKEPEPAPGLVPSMPIPEMSEGLRALSIRSLPFKKRRILRIGESLSAARTPAGDPAHVRGMCSDQESNQQPSGYRMMLQPTEPCWPEPF